MKSLIKVLITTVVMSLQGKPIFAQSASAVNGIYINEQDFITGKLSYVPVNRSKWQLNTFIGGHLSK